MGFEIKKFLTCDRCGASVRLDDAAEPFDIPASCPGWQRIDGSRALCPDCAPGYALLQARHKVELEDYVQGA